MIFAYLTFYQLLGCCTVEDMMNKPKNYIFQFCSLSITVKFQRRSLHHIMSDDLSKANTGIKKCNNGIERNYWIQIYCCSNANHKILKQDKKFSPGLDLNPVRSKCEAGQLVTQQRKTFLQKFRNYYSISPPWPPPPKQLWQILVFEFKTWSFNEDVNYLFLLCRN